MQSHQRPMLSLTVHPLIMTRSYTKVSHVAPFFHHKLVEPADTDPYVMIVVSCDKAPSWYFRSSSEVVPK